MNNDTTYQLDYSDLLAGQEGSDQALLIRNGQVCDHQSLRNADILI